MVDPFAVETGDVVRRFPSLSHWGAFTAVVRDGRLVACEPFAGDPAPSPLLQAMPEQVYSPLRIRKPAVRLGWLRNREGSDRRARGSDPYVEISWDEALRLVADELARVRETFGHEAVFGGSYGWSSAGRLHHARTLTHRFLYAGGGCIDQLGNYSWGAAQFLLPHVIGTYAPVTGRVTDWQSVIENADLVLAFGGLALKNGEITSGGAGEHSMGKWLAAAKRAHVEFVSISPYRGDCPDFLQAEWLGIRPNTDTALLLAMCYVLSKEELCDRRFLETHCTGSDAFERYLSGVADGVEKTPGWAAAICGIPADDIAALARRAAAQRTLVTLAWSLQRGHHGEQPFWAAIAFAAMLGQVGLPGAGFAFGHGSMNGVGNPRPDLPGPEMSAGRNPLGRGIPVARIADALLNPGAPYAFNGESYTYPDIRLVYWAGGNPFHHHQDLNRFVRAWAVPETIVVHETWWTPTARRADIVLPATTTLERNDIGGSSRDRFVFAMQQAIAPVGQARNDFEIYRELAARAGYERGFTEGLDEAGWLRRIYARLAGAWQAQGEAAPDFETFWESGVLELPVPERHYVLFEAFRDDPVGHPLKTPSGRIELVSERIGGFGYDDCPSHPAWLPPAEWLGADRAAQWPLHLISAQPADKLHSQMDAGSVSLAAKVAGRSAIRMHPADAAARGIGAGDAVRVFNQRGACLAGAVLDDGVRPGVVVMQTGAWFDPDGDALERHGNPNVLTRDLGTSQLAQAPSAMSALVDVEKWRLPLPPVRAHTVPEFVTRDPAGE